MNKKTGSRIKELDSLRAIAAISVLFFHYTYGFNHSDTHTLFHKGFMGVELFFVVSGFVIFMTLQRIKETKQFIISRFARLYPAYWFSVFLSFILFSIPFILNNQLQPNYSINEIPISQFVINLTMLQTYFGVNHIDGVYWTLSIELVFYFVMTILFATKKMKYIEIAGWLFVVLLFLNHRFLKIIHIPNLRYGLYFLAGIIYFNIYKDGFQLKKITQYLLLLITLFLNLHYFYHESIDQLIVISIYTIFGLLSIHKLEWLGFEPLAFLGQISYSMYLIHENVGSICFSTLDLIGIHNLWIKILISSSVVFGLAYFSYQVFETKIRKRIIKRLIIR